MDDGEFRRQLKRYLERRGERSGDTLFRTGARVGPVSPAPRSAKTGAEEMAYGKPISEEGRTAKRTAPAAQTPPIRREYAEKGHGTGTAAPPQTDLFGGEQPLPPASDLSGLDLASLEERVSTCTLCPLCGGRNRTVFGSGDPGAKIVFIGEAPGREEDLQGAPFVGRAGQLLTKILASVGFTREEVYITNILKCRPPDNRDPNEQEVRACKPYLKRQIELLRPALICALGRIAGQNLLERNASLSVLRQHIHYYEDVRTIVTYHPAALLRNPNLKRAAWEDIQETRRIFDEALEER